MPLRSLSHDLLRSSIQTPSSPLQSVIDRSRSVQRPDYFDSIDELRQSITNDVSDPPSTSSAIAVQDKASQRRPFRGDKSKVLVCHDFKGGYTEDPFERGYSFEFWHLVDTFIYFSHKRVTIPPRGWLDAGRRHGCRVLGTVIFEWAESKPDLRECLYGEKLDGAHITTDTHNLPFSTQYASRLITLARAHKFDGYLLNIETDLNFLPPASSYPNKTLAEQDEDAVFLSLEQGSTFQELGTRISPEARSRRQQRMRYNADALIAWVGWLHEEGKRCIGPHWEIIWYDSVTTAGQLKWQDALTPANAPFFTNADAIFTNYTWACPQPTPPGALQEPIHCRNEHHPALSASAELADAHGRSRSDVYIGIDVFGRNCYGGFAVDVSLGMIFPTRNRSLSAHESDTQLEDLGLSVALFAPGWTWERESGGERTWSEWWKDELTFWVGHKTDHGHVTSGDSTGAVGSFLGIRERFLLSTSDPVVAYSPISTVPRAILSKDPVSFYTNFNRGSGVAWWVRGHKVYDAPGDSLQSRGWTDIGSCFPKPDRIWPEPVVLQSSMESDGDFAVRVRPLGNEQVSVETWLIDYEVWEGGTALEVRVRAGAGGNSRVFLPLCTLHGCHGLLKDCGYVIEAVVKSLPDSGDISIGRGFHLRPCILWLGEDEAGGKYRYIPSEAESGSVEVRELTGTDGWYGVEVAVAMKSDSDVRFPIGVVPVISLEMGWTSRTAPVDVKLIVGEISLTSLQPSPASASNAAPSESPSASNALNWTAVPPPSGAALPHVLWGVLTWPPDSEETDIRTGYFNVFASRTTLGGSEDGSEFGCTMSRLWLGTATYEANVNSFVVAGLTVSDVPIPTTTRTRVMDEDSAGVPLELQDVGVAAVPDKGDDASSGRLIYFIVERIGVPKGSGRYTCVVEI